MSLNEISLPVVKHRVNALIICLGLLFFGLAFYLRSGLTDFGQPFVIVFVGVVLLSFLSGRFEAFILVFLVVTSSIFEMMEFPTIPIGVGDLFLTDVLVGILLVGRLLKRVTLPVVLIPKPLGYPILAFILLAAFSFFYSIFSFDVSITRAGVMLRPFMYLSLFFVVYYYVNSHSKLRTLLLGAGAIAVILTIMQLLQWLIGYKHNFLYCRVEMLMTAGQKYRDIARVMLPGISLIVFTLDTVIAIYVFKALRLKWRAFVMPAMILLISGLLATFTRSLWIAGLTGALLVLLMARKRVNIYPRILLLLVGACLISTIILQSDLPNAKKIKEVVFDRSLSTFSAVRNIRDDTLFMRFLEYHYAWKKICENPFLGIGLGTSYRPNIFGNVEYEKSEGTWVHNGYIATQLRFGIVGTLLFFWMIIAYFNRIRTHWRRIKDPLYQAVVAGIAAGVMGMLLYNMTTSAFFYIYWIVVFAIGLGVTEKIYQLEGIAE